jgi:hypothetical protein
LGHATATRDVSATFNFRILGDGAKVPRDDPSPKK